MLIPGSFGAAHRKEHSAGAWPAPPNAASHSGMPGHSSSVRGLAVLERRVCCSWLLATANSPSLSQGRQGGQCGVSHWLLWGTSGAGPEALDSGPAQKGVRTEHHGVRIQSHPSSTLRKVQEDEISPWCTVPTAQPLWIPACLPAAAQSGVPWGFPSPFLSPRHLSLCFPAPGVTASLKPGWRKISCNTGMLCSHYLPP